MSWRNLYKLPASKMNKLGCYLTAILYSIYGLNAADNITCEVEVALPWESYTYIPQESSVYINCTEESSKNPTWSIILPGRLTLQFDFSPSIRTLNDHGFYQLPEVDLGMTMKTIRLLINSTMGFNETVVIRCDDIGKGTPIAQTILVVYMPTPVDVYSVDIDIQTANISWNPPSQPFSLMTEDLIYTVMVTSSNTHPHTLLLYQPFYVFSASEGAPPCEVYNFSVTATHVGAIYTGAGCSVPSPVLSRMLPSLPNNQGLESSLNFSIEREGADTVSITVTVKDTSHYCEGYPVTNYTMVVENFFNSSETLSLFMAPNERYISTSNLSENTVYVFRILALNAFGSISTNKKEIYTTDVQLVSAVELRDLSAFRVRCDFMTGSIAQGCMVVLVGELDNITMNFMRGADIEEVINTAYPTSCYNRVGAYDIERDGSVGSLAVPGEILVDTTSNSVALCLQRQNAPIPRLQTMKIVLIVLSVILFVMICTIVCIIILCKLKKRSRFKTTVKSNSLDKLPPVNAVAPPGLSHYSQEHDVPLYELPNNLSPDEKNADTCKSGSEDPSYNVLMHHCEESVLNNEDHDCPAYAMLQEEHVYHVLENGKIQQKLRVVHSTCNDNYDTPEFTSDKPPAEEFPIYQEVSELSMKNPLAVS